MVRVPRHVLNVAVQPHARVEEHGDGGPGAARKAAAEKAVDGCAGLPQARGVRDPDHSAVPEQPERCVPLVGARPHRASAPAALPFRRPQVQ